jgi:hypothetical protein
MGATRAVSTHADMQSPRVVWKKVRAREKQLYGSPGKKVGQLLIGTYREYKLTTYSGYTPSPRRSGR